MPPHYKEDVFTTGMGQRNYGGHGYTDIFDVPSAAFTPPNNHETIKTAKRGIMRAMAEKAVDTAELRDALQTNAFVKTPKIMDRELPADRRSRLSFASSQASYWSGDDEFEHLVNIGDLDDEQSVEEMPDTQPDSAESVTDSATDSNTSINTVSTAQTSVESSSCLSSSDGVRRRKRTDSVDEGHHLSGEKPTQTKRLYRAEELAQHRDTVQFSIISSSKSSHARAEKEAKPIPRLNLNPGPGVAITKTSMVTSHGVLGSAASVNNSVDNFTPLKSVPSYSASYFIIAHDQRVQSLMDKHCIAKGTQLEIARGVTQNLWRWADIDEEKVKLLRGAHLKSMMKVGSVLGKTNLPRPPNFLDTCAELDREQNAWNNDPERGLGLKGIWEGENNWFGGRIQLRGNITLKSGRSDENPESYTVTLKQFSKQGKSYRLARFAGSLSVLQLNFANGASRTLRDGGVELLARRFVLCGRVYCPFYAKDGKAYLVETDECYERKPVRELGDHLRRSFDAYIRWHNSLELNAYQPMSKWATRFALALSTSKPGIVFAPENIFQIDDEYAPGEEICTETTMTDGCGFISWSALIKIAQTLGQDSFRIAVQGRIAGAKGLWILHPGTVHQDGPPRIWIRKSQIKVKFPSQWDRSHLILDIVRFNRLTAPAGVNYQTIMNMSHNGVKDQAFERLMSAALERHIRPLMAWEGPSALLNLAKAVENAGGLMGSRLSRAAGSDARLYGYSRDERDDFEIDEDTNDDKTLIIRDTHSGYPSSLYESAREFLQAGFSPLEHPLLRDKLYYVLTTVVNSCLERFHIPIEMSAEAFIAPDPLGELGENEIYFHCSKGINNPDISTDSCIVLGDVLLFRNPTRVASDIRKVKAVSNNRLTELGYKDIILLSTKGRRSLASYLAGGDYDGDTATVILEPELVNAFKNHSLVEPPKALLENNFEREIEKVSEFLVKCSAQHQEREIYKRLLLGLSDTKVGQYSNFHENAVYCLGYNAPETVRLAYMFTTCLDGSKTGYRAVRDVFRGDEKRWNQKPPPCMQKGEQDPLADTSNRLTVTRPTKLGAFVLDKLKTKGERLKHEAFQEYAQKCNSLNTLKWKDESLLKPWKDFEELIKMHDFSHFKEDHKRIMDFVKGLCDEYIKKAGNHFGNSPRKSGRSTTKSSDQTSSIANIRQEFSARFNHGPSPPLSSALKLLYGHREIMLSYAIHYASTFAGKLASEFPFVIAHLTICGMKANSKGGVVPMTIDFSDYSLLNQNLLKSRAQACNLLGEPTNQIQVGVSR